MKTQTFLQVLFIFLWVFIFQVDGLAQNDTTNDPWKFLYPWNENSTVSIKRDTALTGGGQGVGIGVEFTLQDLHIQTSSPEHGLMVQGHHNAPGETSKNSGRLGFGVCNYFDAFMTLEPHSSGHCKGHLAFWTDETWNNGVPLVPDPTIRMILSNNGALGIGIPVEDIEDIPRNTLLAVAGKAIFEDCEIALRSKWPDYVFNTSHVLPTIEERAAFYTAYERLPNFQSEVEMDGKINVQDILVRQQETIEENAIYITQLNEQNKDLKRELDEIKSLLKIIAEK